MELRIAVRDGLLDPKTHRIMKMMASYVSSTYEVTPDGMDLEDALFQTTPLPTSRIPPHLEEHRDLLGDLRR